MESETIERIAIDEGAVALYLDLLPQTLVDLEVAANAVIDWARALKAAAIALDADFAYRVALIAAEPGSSKWLASIERSSLNKTAERVKSGWEAIPLILRWTVALGVVIPSTAVPTYQYWFGGEPTFSKAELDQFEGRLREVVDNPVVKAHKQAMYKKFPRDRNIVGVGAGVAKASDWKPAQTVPANQFAEADGLFEPQVGDDDERILTIDLDVILVAPQLQNAPRTWRFRQDGIPGTFPATMRDKRFLAALDRSAVREKLRADIPMRVRLHVKERRVAGEWKVTRRGRSVEEVISPSVE